MSCRPLLQGTCSSAEEMVLWPAYAACALLSARYPRLLCPVFNIFRRPSPRSSPVPDAAASGLTLPRTLDPHTSLCLGRALQLLSSAATPADSSFAQSEIARILTAAGGAVGSAGLTPAGAVALEEFAARRSAGAWVQTGVLLRALGGVGWAGALASFVPAALSLRKYLRPLVAVLSGGKQWFLAYYAVLHLPAAASIIMKETGMRGGAVGIEAMGCAAAWSLMLFEEISANLERTGKRSTEWDEDTFRSTPLFGSWPAGAKFMTRWQRKLRSIATVRPLVAGM